LITSSSTIESLRAQGVMLLSLRDGLYIHLFAYHPLFLPLTRLIDKPWDDITPSLSPDGTHLAYSSRQNGYWDIYVLDLVTGTQERLTDTPEYEASPTWSPDGQWIAFERYNGISLDIYLLSLIDPEAGTIQLTNDPGVDTSPTWSPKGREIAFVSTRSGEEEIWLARLDNIDDRFVNISQNSQSHDSLPTWSADGSQLAWASEQDGNRQLAIWRPDQFNHPARLLGEGDRPAWSPDGKILFSEVRDPQSSGLAAYASDSGRLSLPLTPLPGSLSGLTWMKGPIVGWLADLIENPKIDVHSPLWQPVITRTVAPAGRMGLVPLIDVTAPQPLLHDAVDEAFNALRLQVAAETGWDTLSSLENAYVPLTTPPIPSIQNDWLYTGRAFSLNPLLMSAGWMVISKDDFSGQIYWRVYLKARYQDGSMGLPLTNLVWDINARYSGETQAYEQGGKPGQVPVGYWIDLTELTRLYSWERLPAWINWRSFYPSIRYNQFVMTGGLDWNQAMAELYPPEALRTSTSIPTFTPTISETPKAVQRPATTTPTPTLTLIPTRRATWTPSPP
jgi:TolB protein